MFPFSAENENFQSFQDTTHRHTGNGLYLHILAMIYLGRMRVIKQKKTQTHTTHVKGSYGTT